MFAMHELFATNSAYHKTNDLTTFKRTSCFKTNHCR